MKIQQSIVATAAVIVLSFVFGHLVHRAEGADAGEARLQELEDVAGDSHASRPLRAHARKRDFDAYGALFAGGRVVERRHGFGDRTGRDCQDGVCRVSTAWLHRCSEKSSPRDDQLRRGGRRRHGDRVVALDIGCRRRRAASPRRSGRVTTRTRWSESAASGSSSPARRSPKSTDPTVAGRSGWDSDRRLRSKTRGDFNVLCKKGCEGLWACRCC